MKIDTLLERQVFVYGRSVYVVLGAALTGRIRAQMIGKLHLSGRVIPVPPKVKPSVRYFDADTDVQIDVFPKPELD
jgi:hypothetical protein